MRENRVRNDQERGPKKEKKLPNVTLFVLKFPMNSMQYNTVHYEHDKMQDDTDDGHSV